MIPGLISAWFDTAGIGKLSAKPRAVIYLTKCRDELNLKGVIGKRRCDGRTR
jgi:hypothetical protein